MAISQRSAAYCYCREARKQPGTIKPFMNLRVAQLLEELHAREIFSTDCPKKELQEVLTHILKGVQRVPTLLLFNPTQELDDLHLGAYTVLDCEPLHDLKGHLGSLFKELPHILPHGVREKTKEIIEANTKDKMTGADHRMIAIELRLSLVQASVDPAITLLTDTAVRISELLYLPEEKRTPCRILQLYNCTWLHHQLCSTMFTTFHGDMSRSKFFGTYLHAIVVHAPSHLEIISLFSVNTENQERIFGQACKTATATSNRQPHTLISTILLRLQAKSQYRDIYASVKQGESRVAKAGANIPPYEGTVVKDDFIQPRIKSWQAHLERLSRFLVAGEGVWWEKTQDGYHFFDGDGDLECHNEGPPLLHHRSVLLQEVGKQQRAAWKMILHHGIKIPTPRLYLYDEAGNPVPSSDQSTSVNSESTLSHQTSHQLCPTEYDSIPSHQTNGQSILSQTTSNESIPSYTSNNQSIASHPTSDQTIASHETSDQTIVSHQTSDQSHSQ